LLRDFDKIRPGDNFFMDDLMFELSSEPNFRENFCILWPGVLSIREERLESNEGPGVEVDSASFWLLGGKGGGTGCKGLDPPEGPGTAGGNGAGAAGA
jgi:hypothetical protein